MKANLNTTLANKLKLQTSLQEQLSQLDIANNLDTYSKLTKEIANLQTITQPYLEYLDVVKQVKANQQLLSETASSELQDMIVEDNSLLQKKLETLEQQLVELLLPVDEDDDKNVFLEIRAGTGGEESALFVSDLFRMYSRFASNNNWATEVISLSESDLGGIKEIILRLSGKQVYAKLKFESGTHRVQRIPSTETQGRVHTSAATVAVLPEVEQVAEVNLDPSELRIDTFRASGAGGQHVNKTDSAIRITHLPSGLVVECQDDRSQHRNKAKAMALLASKLREKLVNEQKAHESATRRNLIGSGDRSERIRTYNFPQNRLTDHRINLTLYNLGLIMEGQLEAVTKALQLEYHNQQLTEAGFNE